MNIQIPLINFLFVLIIGTSLVNHQQIECITVYPKECSGVPQFSVISIKVTAWCKLGRFRKTGINKAFKFLQQTAGIGYEKLNEVSWSPVVKIKVWSLSPICILGWIR